MRKLYDKNYNWHKIFLSLLKRKLGVYSKLFAFIQWILSFLLHCLLLSSLTTILWLHNLTSFYFIYFMSLFPVIFMFMSSFSSFCGVNFSAFYLMEFLSTLFMALVHLIINVLKLLLLWNFLSRIATYMYSTFACSLIFWALTIKQQFQICKTSGTKIQSFFCWSQKLRLIC